MTYKEDGFRAFYHQFCVVPITKKVRKLLDGFPGENEANGILTYGYYDREVGLTLEVLAAALMDGEHARFGVSSNTISSKIRIDVVAEDNCFFFPDDNGSLSKRYANKLKTLEAYNADEYVERTRRMMFLDDCRHERYIDDIKVIFAKNGLQREEIWTRITGLTENRIIGVLLNELYQDFGYHEGDIVMFFAQKTDGDKFVCVADINANQKITAEDLADGSVLEAVVSRFNKKQNEENLIEVLAVLRDSNVWIPCNAVMADEDRNQIESMIKNNAGDIEKLVGEKINTKGAMRLIPDVLQSGDEFYFPIFSTVEAMGEYGESFSKVQHSVLKAISMAKNNEKNISGLVLNAFTEPFILDKDLWNAFEKMESSL